MDIWERVERQLGIGLRSSDPELRAKFFKLYNGHVEPTLFERLKFIVCVQSWEEMAGTFWLKQGLVSAWQRPVYVLVAFACLVCAVAADSQQLSIEVG